MCGSLKKLNEGNNYGIVLIALLLGCLVSGWLRPWLLHVSRHWGRCEQVDRTLDGRRLVQQRCMGLLPAQPDQIWQHQVLECHPPSAGVPL